MKVEGKVNEYFNTEKEQRTSSTGNVSVKWTGRDTIRVSGVGDFAPEEEKMVSAEQAALVSGVGSELFEVGGKAKVKAAKAKQKKVAVKEKKIAKAAAVAEIKAAEVAEKVAEKEAAKIGGK